MASPDGCIATPDGGLEWLAPFEGTGEDYGYAKFYACSYANGLVQLRYVRA